MELKSVLHFSLILFWIGQVFTESTDSPVTVENNVSLEIVLKPLAGNGPAPAVRTRTHKPKMEISERTTPSPSTKIQPVKTVSPSLPPAESKVRKGIVDSFGELALTPYWDLDMAEGEDLTLDCGVYTKSKKDITIEWWKDGVFLNTSQHENRR